MTSRTTILSVTLAFTLGAFAALPAYPQDKAGADKEISPSELYKALVRGDTSLIILDVRTPEEFEGSTGHIAGAQLLPVQDLEARISDLDSVKHKSIAVYCRTGNRSGVARRILTEHGFKARNITGGIVRWNNEGLPVEKPKTHKETNEETKK